MEFRHAHSLLEESMFLERLREPLGGDIEGNITEEELLNGGARESKLMYDYRRIRRLHSSLDREVARIERATESRSGINHSVLRALKVAKLQCKDKLVWLEKQCAPDAKAALHEIIGAGEPEMMSLEHSVMQV